MSVLGEETQRNAVSAGGSVVRYLSDVVRDGASKRRERVPGMANFGVEEKEDWCGSLMVVVAALGLFCFLFCVLRYRIPQGVGAFQNIK